MGDAEEPDAALRKAEAAAQMWIGSYLEAQTRFESVCMAVFQKAVDGGSLFDVVELVGDWMDGCDCVDDESIALFTKAMETAGGPGAFKRYERAPDA